ncbi:hypothetical protein BRC93_06285 [Halobacteriales archaeon QS_5_70_15]|nr:MAG: hypothetical protein BRC93_06285 [Halobacteriales archaeon QS_5_70_15]
MTGEDSGPFASALRGGVGGFVATVVMTLFRVRIFRALPPPSEFWAQYLGGGPAEAYRKQGFVLHLSYGSTAGGILGSVFPYVDRHSPLGTETTALLSGALYGVVLAVFGDWVIFARVLDRDLEDEHGVVFHVDHVVWGLTLGMWLGERERRGEVYESPSEGSETAPAR